MSTSFALCFTPVARIWRQRHFAGATTPTGAASVRSADGKARRTTRLARIRAALAVPLAAAMFAGCAGIEPAKYADERPALDLPRYFNGIVDGHGVFQKRSGEVVKRFHVVIDARWQGDRGVLDEHFTWSDGSTSRRVWTLTRQADGTFRGTADDVVGEATGEVGGNALRWRYVLALPVDGRVWHVNFDDWMFLIDNDVMLNRAVMSKWGFRLGEVTLAFRKR